MTRDERRAAELQRGAEITAKNFIAKEFDPDYVDMSDSRITPQERARRDEYRRNCVIPPSFWDKKPWQD